LKVRIEPEKVRIATELYRKQNDSYRQFVDECIKQSTKSLINITELYAQFREWFKEGFPGHQLPLKNEVKDYFIKLWGEAENGKWRGYRIKTIADEIDSGTALVVEEDELINYDNISNFTPL
jgi:phage/plasmid-associated DNA primase